MARSRCANATPWRRNASRRPSFSRCSRKKSSEPGSVVTGAAPEVIEHPDFLPDTVTAGLGDLSEVVAFVMGMEKAQFGIEAVELVLNRIEVRQRLHGKGRGEHL